MLTRLLCLAHTVFKLGLLNFISVLSYRILLKARYYTVKLPKGSVLPGSLFLGNRYSTSTLPEPASSKLLIQGTLTLYSAHTVSVNGLPDFMYNYLEQSHYKRALDHWSELDDFEQGDIKGVWELSRCDWALLAARGLCTTKDISYLTFLNDWLDRWIQQNPVNQGPNWKCGQETAIRMLQVLLTARLLNEHFHPTQALVAFVSAHCNRIEPTIYYALAQNNNHSTSEAAALFIGGNWLLQNQASDLQQAERWAKLGRDLLEKKVAQLVAEDGSFSQYSVNYHRVLIDTLSIVEYWRLIMQLPEFSDVFRNRAAAATHWLWQFTAPETGDAPNIGNNDGARLFLLSETEYRDFRPSVQLAGFLLGNKRYYPEAGTYDQPFEWLQLPVTSPLSSQSRFTESFPHGGYAMLHSDNCWGVVRYPQHHFRPGHADPFHLDLFVQGQNILRDGGTYSYNCPAKSLDYFSGIASHNSIEFDGSEPMLRLNRFLFGYWLKSTMVNMSQDNGNDVSWTGAYTDYRGCRHQRTILMKHNILLVQDEVSGFKHSAKLRWRLIPAQWQRNQNTIESEWGTISIKTGSAPCNAQLCQGWESRHYGCKTLLPVFEIEVNKPTTITTKIEVTTKVHKQKPML